MSSDKFSVFPIQNYEQTYETITPLEGKIDKIVRTLANKDRSYHERLKIEILCN